MKSVLLAAALALGAIAPASAQHEHSGHGSVAPAKATAGQLDNSGEVKRVNTDTKKITIAHGPLKAFDMPPMTMAFPVKDPALLGKVKAGDKVRFGLEKAGEDLVITRIEAAR
ncbi:MAG TPA: copper-binding protein [Burkholderiaceae bacterium]|nr:copper-binding protein [Burkholderiaceae bacterium]